MVSIARNSASLVPVYTPSDAVAAAVAEASSGTPVLAELIAAIVRAGIAQERAAWPVQERLDTESSEEAVAPAKQERNAVVAAVAPEDAGAGARDRHSGSGAFASFCWTRNPLSIKTLPAADRTRARTSVLM